MGEIERQKMLRAQEDEPERIIISRAGLPCQDCATLTTERDAAEESRRFYMAERDRLREALERMCFAYAGEMAARAAGVEIKGFPLLGAYQHAHTVLYGEDEPERRALAGTGETPWLTS